ncbi:6-phosphofructokinase [Chitinivibrio alkaliphilus]|uniref:ATP-dependent 6-phosphofructokinase n=1 Tax=Chitinivibrio alkaliphilus ACht1 TaxID=1313304 RepID=U7D707_9BACT|nr:ATP-dependent 6-phosphofructokinase [Chitinivibrio alkaliphilus]ERP30857.1 phosphofructokinase [Chitinivibrio alkaliphilus ACht1]
MGKEASKAKCIALLTSGGDCPGLNAVIRGVAKPALHKYGMKVLGIQNGFRGLVENKFITLTDAQVSGILTKGGTILGTSRDKPKKMKMGEQFLDMTRVAGENLQRMQVDCVVCLGGGGTQKNALHLWKKTGIPVITIPKTIDNDVYHTDITFGFDTAMTTATEALDRLHTTATSHQRIMVCEIMGHNAGWLTLGAGIAGGADVILIPEIPYSYECIAESLKERRRMGKNFSIVALAEGAMAQDEVDWEKTEKKGVFVGKDSLDIPLINRVAQNLTELTNIESRVTTLGHILRGGTPSATDRLLSTQMGVTAARLCAEGQYNVMVAYKNSHCTPVPLTEVAGKKKVVPQTHPWITAARMTGTCLGD